MQFNLRLDDIPEREREPLPYPPALRKLVMGSPKERIRLAVLVVGPFAIAWFGALLLGATGPVMILLGAAFAFWFLLSNRLVTNEVARLRGQALIKLDPHNTAEDVTINAAGITRKNPHWKIHQSWSVFTGCAAGREGVYLWTGLNRALYVPDAVLPDGITRAAFCEQVERWANDR